MPQSITSQPVASSPAFTAMMRVSPDVLVSLPTAMRPFRKVPSASPIQSTGSGVTSLPMMPRTPFVPNNRFCIFFATIILYIHQVYFV